MTVYDVCVCVCVYVCGVCLCTYDKCQGWGWGWGLCVFKHPPLPKRRKKESNLITLWKATLAVTSQPKASLSVFTFNT